MVILIIIALTLLLGLGWKLISRKKSRKIGLWLNLALYLGLGVILWLNYISLWWILLISAFSGLFGAFIGSQNFRDEIFGRNKKIETKHEVEVEPKEEKPKKSKAKVDQPTISNNNIEEALKNATVGQLMIEITKRDKNAVKPKR